ncbi:MAG: class I mannose-6-phosphate isomerase [Bacteroidales bacterium]|nr:class I mannose-6-phosphate isomerase [Bacteroidales bacterium]
MVDMYPFLFQPNLHTLVWGGHRLKPMKGLPADDEPIGESWEVSAVPSSQSIIANGSFAGKSLVEMVETYGDFIIGHANLERYGRQFPLLIKFIDAKRDLSIQVHPNDELAAARHGKLGKTEMWYIIDAEPGACLYSGFSKKITQEEYCQKVADGTITDVLARHTVHKGDVFYIPAGRVHAICGGILLAEVQQSSDVTYRIFDYNRLGLDGRPRELHTELAVDAIDFDVQTDYLTHYRRRFNRPEPVIESPYFKVKMLKVSRKFHRKMFKYDTFVIYMCLKGSCTIRMRGDDSSITLNENNTALIPACVADYDVIPCEKRTKLLEIYIDNRQPNFWSKVKNMFRHN